MKKVNSTSFQKSRTKKIQRLFDSFDDLAFLRYERIRQNIALNTAICRKLKDQSLQSLANNINTSRPTIIEIEKASSDPTLSTIILLCEEFNIHPLSIMMNDADLELLKLPVHKFDYERYYSLGINNDNAKAVMQSRLDKTHLNFAKYIGKILTESLSEKYKNYYVQIGLCIMFGLKSGNEKSVIKGYKLGKMLAEYTSPLGDLEILTY